MGYSSGRLGLDALCQGVQGVQLWPLASLQFTMADLSPPHWQQALLSITLMNTSHAMTQALTDFEQQQPLRTDPRFDELWTLVRSQTLLRQRLAELDHQVSSSCPHRPADALQQGSPMQCCPSSRGCANSAACLQLSGAHVHLCSCKMLACVSVSCTWEEMCSLLCLMCH